MLLNELSDREHKLVQEFRERMKNDLKQDMYEDILLFYRFLKAREFDVDEAEKMLRKNLVWRKLHQIDTILVDFKPKEFYLQYYEPSLIGYDKEDSLVIYLPSGKMETKEALKCFTISDYKKHIVWQGEKFFSYAKQHYEQNLRSCLNLTLILDLDKLTFGNVTYPTTAEMNLFVADVTQNNYPETLKAVYIINAPAYYVIVFAVVKAIMSNVMIQKIHTFGRSGWKEALLKAIDADVLPTFLGGNRTDPDGDPLCKSFMRHAGAIPPVYFLSDEERYFRDKSRVSKLIVPSMNKREICVDVKETCSIIAWEFHTKSSNIGFGLFYQSEKKLEEVIPIEKYSTADGAEKNSHKAQNIGKYIAIFDNSHSWLISKEVEYCIDVISDHYA